jgi:hypothetical protein
LTYVSCNGTKILASDAPKQSGQARPVGVRDGNEFQPEAMTWFRVAYHRISSDLTLGNEKLKISRSTDLAWRGCSQEQTTETHVKDTRDIVMSITTPTNPHFFVQTEPRVESA